MSPRRQMRRAPKPRPKTTKGPAMDFDTWLSYGQMKGWIMGDPVCSTHDLIPATGEEQEDWDEGLDPCAVVVRLAPSR